MFHPPSSNQAEPKSMAPKSSPKLRANRGGVSFENFSSKPKPGQRLRQLRYDLKRWKEDLVMFGRHFGGFVTGCLSFLVSQLEI